MSLFASSPPQVHPRLTTSSHTQTQIEFLKAQEEASILPTFDSDVAWILGSLIRAHCQRHPRPAVVYIAHAASSQLLFFAPSRPGTIPDNMHWVRRMEAVVLRWGMASLRMRCQLQDAHPGRCVQEALRETYELADPSMYACRGGGFPIRVRSVEGVVGVIVVSGLKEEDNHIVVVDGIQEYLGRSR